MVTVYKDLKMNINSLMSNSVTVYLKNIELFIFKVDNKIEFDFIVNALKKDIKKYSSLKKVFDNIKLNNRFKFDAKQILDTNHNHYIKLYSTDGTDISTLEINLIGGRLFIS